MATLYSHPFTAANDTLWTAAAVAFDKVLGTTSVDGLVATVHGNKGIAADTGNESIYRSQFASPFSDYKVSALMEWDDAAGSGREGGVGVRVSADGLEGYFATLDSNFGTTRVRLRRRTAGVFHDIGGGFVPTIEGAGDFNAGVTLTLRVQNRSDGVHLKVMVGTNVYFDVVDAFVAGVSIDSGLYSGIYFDAACESLNGIAFDDFVAKDFEDEATSGYDWQTGVGLIINGVPYSEAEWRAAGLDPVSARSSYAAATAGQINDLNGAGAPFLHVGDWVKILYNNVALAEGKLAALSQDFAPPESIGYTLISPRQLGEQVPLIDPKTEANFKEFNLDSTSENYDADFDDMTIGDILAWLYDNHTTGEDGLRARQSGPASGDAYVAAELTALDAKIPNLAISGTLLQAEETLLSYMPEYGIRVDPDTRIRHVDKRSASATRTLSTSADHYLAQLTRDITKNYTCAFVFGTVPNAEETTLLWDPNDPDSALKPLWDRGLESVWSVDKSKTVKNEGTVIGYGIEGPSDPDNPNFLYVTLDTSGSLKMDKNEWAGTLFAFLSGAEAGMVYTVRGNTAGGKVWLKAFAWQAGGPAVNDTASLSGIDDPNYRRNGHNAAFSEFDTGGTLAAGPCANAIVTHKVATRTIQYPVKMHRFELNQNGKTTDGIRLDLPAIGLVNFLGTMCGETGGGGAEPATSVEITVPLTDADKKVPTFRFPEKGFRGTAYSTDESRWDGGGTARVGIDAGWERPMILNFPDYQRPDLQRTEYEAAVASMLAVYGALAISGTVVHQTLDTTWVGLNKRLRLLDDEAGQPTGYEGSNDLWLLVADFDLRNDVVSLGIGTLSAQGVDLEAQRKMFAERTRLDTFRRQRLLAQQLRDCLANAFKGAPGATDGGSNPVPGCNVTSDVPGVSMSTRVSNVVNIWFEWTEFIDWLLEVQKGITVQRGPNGELLNLPDLTDTLDAARLNGFGGVEGGVAATVFANKAAGEGLHFAGFVWHEGKCYPSFSATGTGVVPPPTVYVDPATNGFFSKFNPDGTPDSTSVFVPPLGGWQGGLLSNLGKTVGKTGLVLPADATGASNTDGAWHYPHGGVPTWLPPGTAIPPSLSDQVESFKRAGFGVTPLPNNTIQTPATHGASVYAPNANYGFTKISGPGLPGPSVGGFVGNLSGKCGSTFDGRADPGSGPGALVTPGAGAAADGAYYYPPSELMHEPEVHQLAAGDIAPASSVTIAQVFQRMQGFRVHAISDRGGVIFQGPGFEGAFPSLYWRVDAGDAQRRLRSVTNTPGAGLNSGDWSWASPAVYISRCTLWTEAISPNDLVQDALGGPGVVVPVANASGFVGGIALPLAAPSAVGAQIEVPRCDVCALPIRVQATVEPVGVGGGNFDVGMRYQVVNENAVIGAMVNHPTINNVNAQFARGVTWVITPLIQPRYMEVSISRPNPGAGADTSANAMTVRGILVSGYYVE